MQTLTLVLLILLAAFLSLIVFWKKFRDYLGNKIVAAGKLVKTHFPAVYDGIKKFFRFLARIIGAYALFILISSLVATLLIIIALLSGSSTFIAIAFILALFLLFLAWLPTGVILRVFGINKVVIPQSLKTFVSWVALFGFLAMLYPNLLSFKLFLALNLLGLIVFGMAARFKFLDKVVVPLIIFICFIYAWQYFLPDSYRSTTRYLSSWTKKISSFTDRGSLGNEVQAVATYGSFLKDITVLYQLTDDGGLHDFDTLISKETVIKVVDHKEEVMVYEGQGFVLIQLAKENGSFVGGDKYWIEAEFVRLINPKKLVYEKASNLNSSSSQSKNSNQKSRELEDKNIVYDRNKIDFLLYGTGKTYAYELQAGEFTPWRGFKDNYFSNAGISSETYDYTIYFSDGTSYKGGPDTPIPVKKGNVFVRVKANSAQTVYISVL